MVLSVMAWIKIKRTYALLDERVPPYEGVA